MLDSHTYKTHESLSGTAMQTQRNSWYTQQFYIFPILPFHKSRMKWSVGLIRIIWVDPYKPNSKVFFLIFVEKYLWRINLKLMVQTRIKPCDFQVISTTLYPTELMSQLYYKINNVVIHNTKISNVYLICM